jgi:hypothetical protein
VVALAGTTTSNQTSPQKHLQIYLFLVERKKDVCVTEIVVSTESCGKHRIVNFVFLTLLPSSLSEFIYMSQYIRFCG